MSDKEIENLIHYIETFVIKHNEQRKEPKLSQGILDEGIEVQILESLEKIKRPTLVFKFDSNLNQCTSANPFSDVQFKIDSKDKVEAEINSFIDRFIVLKNKLNSNFKVKA